eukprot:TRINITY_DN22119_c0_g1_i1.p1 TRINITY_DN22119_c0_g1~~TRINITY_DN22119_c0_g1_i1.p1  ORF type:complete len:283 (+),score=71.03 TRINITY_DN22119_c0_g1_i1:13-861(+)
MYSVQSEFACDVPAHLPPELARQKRPVVQVVHEISDSEEPPQTRRVVQKSEESNNSIFGDALSRLLIGQIDAERAAAASGGSSSSSSFVPQVQSMPVPESGEASMLRMEVERIRAAGADEFRVVLGIDADAELDLQAVQSRYRNLMRLLHPDKRSKVAEVSAGGKAACDEAIERVQKALQAAKKEIEAGPDPSRIAMQSMRRMQETQRQRARQAMQRHQDAEVGDLVEEVESILAEGDPSFIPGWHAPPTRKRGRESAERAEEAPDMEAQKIIDLLAQMGQT